MSDEYAPRILSIEETKKLIDACYYREMAAIKGARYKASIDQAKDMRACNSAHAAAIDLLQNERDDSACDKQKLEEIRQSIWQAVRGSLRNAIDNIRNMTLRQQYISQIKTNALSFKKELIRIRFNAIRLNAGANFSEQARNILEVEIAELAEQAAAARNMTLNFTRTQLSKPSLAFSQWIKEQGLNYEDLVARYTTKAHAQGKISGAFFNALTNEERLVVFDEIIIASGRSNSIVNIFSKAFGVMGGATIILTLGCIVWDVVESSNPSLTAVNHAIVLGAGVVGAELGVELGAAVGLAGGPLGIFVGGVLGGIIAGFGTGLAASNLFDAMVAALSGEISSDLTDHRIWGNPIVYTPVLPNAAELSTSLFPSERA